MLILVTTTGCQAQPYVTPQSPITLTSTIVQTNMVSTTVTLPVSTITTTINSVQILPCIYSFFRMQPQQQPTNREQSKV